MIPRKLQRIVNDDPVLSSLWDRTQSLRELQKLYLDLVPANLRAISRVGSMTGDELKLFADSGAAASRLRLLAPTLLAEFRSKGWQFNSVRVAVQVKTDMVKRPGPTRKSVDTDGRKALARLAETLPDSPLQQALRRLSKAK